MAGRAFIVGTAVACVAFFMFSVVCPPPDASLPETALLPPEKAVYHFQLSDKTAVAVEIEAASMRATVVRPAADNAQNAT